MITIHPVIQGSQEWHKLHDGLWTGSTAIKLLQGKKLPEWTDFGGNKWTDRGKLLEPIAIREYERETEAMVERAGFVTNSKYPNAGFSPDGLEPDIVVEVKCLNGERHEALVNGNIPVEILSQIHFGMVICEKSKGVLLAFNPDFEPQLTIIKIEKNKIIEDNIQHHLERDMDSRK